jgi:putative tricarboxylic transport membrane protein
MRLKAAPGEIILGLAFVGVGLFWLATALKMQLWDGFAPASGFLPLIFGVLLVFLAAAAVLFESHSGDPSSEAAGPIARPLQVIAVLAVGISGIEYAGFFASMFVMMFVLFKVIERLPLVQSLMASVGSALVLTLVFRTWLGVPMPSGPWGF